MSGRGWSLALTPSLPPNERARLDMDTLTDKSAPQPERSGDVAPLGLVDVYWGRISIKMPALRASSVRHVQFLLGQGGRNIYGSEPIDLLGSVELPESRCDFTLHDANGEMLMRKDCTEIGGGGGRQRGRIKAVPMHRDRTPSSGGIAEGLGENERRWGVRRPLSEADGELLGMHEMPESRCDFILHDADGEMLMRKDCTEYGGVRRGVSERAGGLSISINGRCLQLAARGLSFFV
jgi:hypothetical protein